MTDYFDLAVNAWQEAGRTLGISVEAPYILNAEGVASKCVAYLPHFGGPNGMLIWPGLPPGVTSGAELVAAAKKNGYYYSCINVERYSHFDSEIFKEALIDWSYYGPADKLPSWIPAGRA